MQNIKLLLLTLLIPLWAHTESLTGTVLDVHDGDTLTIQVPSENNKRYKVRMMGVDTPEIDFFEHSQGEAAFTSRDFLRRLLPIGSTATVQFETNGMDKHNRLLGRVSVDGVEVNRELLNSGWGYLYFIYPFDKKLAVEYSALAKSAIEAQRGLFSEKFGDLQAPYQFRLSVRNQEGKNLVGNLQTKRLYNQDNIQQVPLWDRVFFPDEALAKSNGYSF